MAPYTTYRGPYKFYIKTNRSNYIIFIHGILKGFLFKSPFFFISPFLPIVAKIAGDLSQFANMTALMGCQFANMTALMGCQFANMTALMGCQFTNMGG